MVWIPPGEKHWHGAAPNSSMAHIAIVEQLDGKAVEWMEKVSDAQYGAPLRAQAVVTFNVKNFLAARSLGFSILAPKAFLARMELQQS